MAMSTADSALNSCLIMVSHDIVKNLQKENVISDTRQLKIDRWTTLTIGLLCMITTFKCNDLLKLMYWSLDCKVPILPAPFILAIFGFRGTARTTLIGMTTGVLTILAWNKWLKPITEMNGSFLAMLANSLAMMSAHYLLKQPKDAGWVKPDSTFQQMQQEYSRKQAERKEAIKNAWASEKIIFSKLVPSRTTMVYMGFYFFVTSLLAYFIAHVTNYCFLLILHLSGSAY